MLFGKHFKVLKDIPFTFVKVGDKYPEFFWAYEESGKLEYCIMDDNFGQPSPANSHKGDYAKKLRARSEKVLQELLNDEYIELIVD